ncbi:hypothetical protein ES702_04261 [subsurface metagenome]
MPPPAGAGSVISRSAFIFAVAQLHSIARLVARSPVPTRRRDGQAWPPAPQGTHCYLPSVPTSRQLLTVGATGRLTPTNCPHLITQRFPNIQPHATRALQARGYTSRGGSSLHSQELTFAFNTHRSMSYNTALYDIPAQYLFLKEESPLQKIGPGLSR